jgi:hypothetical protein
MSSTRDSRPRRTRLGAAVAGALLAGIGLAAAPARAQQLEPPRGRQGYYLGGGLFGVANHAWEDGEALGVWGGSGLGLRAGQLLTPRFGLGLQLQLGGASGDGQTAALFGFGLEGQATLVRNLAARAGVGFGFITLDDPDVDEGEIRGGAGGFYMLGLSYDFFPFRDEGEGSGGFAISPTVELRFLPGGDVKTAVAFIGVDLLWWTGLPRNQLELPDAEAYKKK